MENNSQTNQTAIRKAIIPVAGMGTRFLPLSKSVPKELWPLVEKPVIQYIVEEAMNSGIKEIIFVVKPQKEKQLVLDYFQEKLVSNNVSGARYKSHFAKALEDLEKISQNISFKSVEQKEPLGDGHAILQAKKFVNNEPCAVLWADDVVESATPCLAQLISAFEKYLNPMMAAAKIKKEFFQFYGMIDGIEVDKGIFEIKKIIEKPAEQDSPSNLAAIGRYVLTPEAFEWLEKAEPNEKGELVTNEIFNKMTMAGKKLYACEFEGKWLECGNKLAWLKSNIYLGLKHPEFGPELKKLFGQA